MTNNMSSQNTDLSTWITLYYSELRKDFNELMNKILNFKLITWQVSLWTLEFLNDIFAPIAFSNNSVPIKI